MCVCVCVCVCAAVTCLKVMLSRLENNNYEYTTNLCTHHHLSSLVLCSLFIVQVQQRNDGTKRIHMELSQLTAVRVQRLLCDEFHERGVKVDTSSL